MPLVSSFSSGSSGDKYQVGQLKQTLRTDLGDSWERYDGGYGLPEGYTPLEYISATGAQYIDTGFTPSNNTKLEINASINSGNFYASVQETNRFGLYLVTTNNRIDMSFGQTGYVGSVLTGISFPAIVTFENSKLTANNAVYNFTSQSSFTTTNTLPLFAENSSGSISYSYGECYYCKIYESGTLVRDFVPCKNSSGVAGLYDRVNKTFYSSKTSTAFIAGNVINIPENTYIKIKAHNSKYNLPSGYKILDYIESSGSQYIDTGVGVNYKMALDIEFINTGSQNLMGNSASAGYYFGTDASGYYTVATTSTVNGFVRRVIDVESTTNGISLTADGTTVTKAKTDTTQTSTLYLFAINGYPTAYKTSAKLYSCKIYDNDTLIRNYIPVMNDNGIAGLWDLINKSFYSSVSSTAFIAGNILE